MSEDLHIPRNARREEQYDYMLQVLQKIAQDERDIVANMANFAAVMKEVLRVLWVGFYRLIGDELVLGPFQGPLACSRIAIERGVCGACVREGRTLVVPDVEKFPGHIACSSRSRSEIVVPIVAAGRIRGVLDVDSEQLGHFGELDAVQLERVVALLAQRWPD